ncbi:MAG TPA: hypothetical protein VFZ78_02210, partial [Flavisolibacter sp.]
MRVITILLLLSGCLLMTACSTTRNLPAGEKLYVGADVDLNGPDLTARQKKTLRNDLEGLTRPRPNSRLLGIPIKLSFYNMFYKSKPGSFFGKIRDKFGEPPVLGSQFDLQKNVDLLDNYLENKGFFKAVVKGDTVVKRKKMRAKFDVETGYQYKINAVHFPADSSDLSTYIRNSAAQTILRPGEGFDLDVIKGERIRIDAFLKERGFYFFSPEYLLVQTDSTIGGNLVNMHVV